MLLQWSKYYSILFYHYMVQILRKICFVCDETVYFGYNRVTDDVLYTMNICSCGERTFHEKCLNTFCNKCKIGDNVVCNGCNTNITQKLNYEYISLLTSFKGLMFMVGFSIILISSLLMYMTLHSLVIIHDIVCATSIILPFILSIYTISAKRKEDISSSTTSLLLHGYINHLILLITSLISHKYPSKLHPNTVGIIYMVIACTILLLLAINTIFKRCSFTLLTSYVTTKVYKIKDEHLILVNDGNNDHDRNDNNNMIEPMRNIVENNDCSNPIHFSKLYVTNILNASNKVTREKIKSNNSIEMSQTYSPCELVGVAINNDTDINCDAIV